MGLDRVGSPPGVTVLATVTGRGRRDPAGPYGHAARRRPSSRWRVIAGSRYECIDVAPHLMIYGVPPARRVGGPEECDCLPALPPVRLPARASALARTTSGSRGSAGGPPAMGARAGPSAGGYGSAALFLTFPGQPPIPVDQWRLARPRWPGSSGNGTKAGRRGASPKSACRVECRGAAIPHPKVLPGAAVGRGSGARRSHRLDAGVVATDAEDQRDGDQPG